MSPERSVVTAVPVLEVENLVRHFPVGRGFFSRDKRVVRAVDGVSWRIGPASSLGLVGESGCGKTTTARLILKLDEPTSGAIRFLGRELVSLDKEAVRAYRKAVQAVFQDPYASLNPRMRVDEIIMEPLVTNEKLPKAEVRARVEKLLDVVGLPRRSAELFPHEFSGGQRQRIAIARAL